MRILYLLLRALVFLLLLGLAVKNDGMVTVKAYFDTAWQLPLVVVMLLMFAAGLLGGVAVLSARVASQRREIQRLQATRPLASPLPQPGATRTLMD
ncbi:MAG: LapA family protein [Candidatus Dactylopiibacterium sp.]|nr:LapA family protein [Candidatus Dactylopiibacterium sp.]